MWVKFVFVGLIVHFVISQSPLEEACKTPNEEDGLCIPIKNCPALLSIIKGSQLNQSSIEFLRKYQCGFENKSPKVCCVGVKETSPTSNITSGNSNILPDRSQCGVVLEDRILGGERADLGEFRWMALVEFEKDDKTRTFYCSGTLISKRYVLTAAHCINGVPAYFKWKLTSVRLGDYDLENDRDCVDLPFSKYCADPPLNISVEEVIAHENYTLTNRNQKFDIGLLRLAQDVPFSSFVGPLCLPTSEKEKSRSYENKKTYVSGWGETEQSVKSKIQLKLEMPIVNFKTCFETYKTESVQLVESQMCAGGQLGIDTCKGDNGGPLMVIDVDENGEPHWYGIGIASFGLSQCGKQDWPGVYTRISDYTDWIISKMRN